MLKLAPVNDDQFRIAMETISRMGVAKKKEKIFFQSCYIVSLNNEYFIVNYKEILGKEMEGNDHARVNTVAILLEEWGIVKIANKADIDKFGTLPNLKVLKNKEKTEWKIMGKIPNFKIAKFIALHKQNNKNPKNSEKTENK